MTDTAKSMNSDPSGLPLDGLDQIDALNRVRHFLDVAYLMIEQSGRMKGAHTILTQLNEADQLIAEVVKQIETGRDAGDPG